MSLVYVSNFYAQVTFDCVQKGSNLSRFFVFLENCLVIFFVVNLGGPYSLVVMPMPLVVRRPKQIYYTLERGALDHSKKSSI